MIIKFLHEFSGTFIGRLLEWTWESIVFAFLYYLGTKNSDPVKFPGDVQIISKNYIDNYLAIVFWTTISVVTKFIARFVVRTNSDRGIKSLRTHKGGQKDGYSLRVVGKMYKIVIWKSCSDLTRPYCAVFTGEFGGKSNMAFMC